MSPLKNFLMKKLLPLVMPQKEALCTSDLGPRKSQDAPFFLWKRDVRAKCPPLGYSFLGKASQRHALR